MLTFKELATHLERRAGGPESESGQKLSLEDKRVFFVVEDDLDSLSVFMENLLLIFSRHKVNPDNYLVIGPNNETTFQDVRKVLSPDGLRNLLDMGVKQVVCFLDKNLSEMIGGDENSGYEIALEIFKTREQLRNEDGRKVLIIGASLDNFPPFFDDMGKPCPLVDFDPTKSGLREYLNELVINLTTKQDS